MLVELPAQQGQISYFDTEKITIVNIPDSAKRRFKLVMSVTQRIRFLHAEVGLRLPTD